MRRGLVITIRAGVQMYRDAVLHAVPWVMLVKELSTRLIALSSMQVEDARVEFLVSIIITT